MNYTDPQENYPLILKLAQTAQYLYWDHYQRGLVFLTEIKYLLSAGISESFLNSAAANSGADTATSSRLLSPPPAASSVATVVPGEADNSLESGEWAPDTRFETLNQRLTLNYRISVAGIEAHRLVYREIIIVQPIYNKVHRQRCE